MKKMFTLLALLACFMGAKAEWVEDYSYDFSSNTAFPYYVMGYVPEWVDGVMTDYGAMFGYKTDDEIADYEFKEGESEVGTVSTQAGVTYHKIQLAAAGWHQYFIADGIKTEIGESYTVTAMVRASEQVSINVNMGWGWGDGQQKSASVSIGTDWAEVEWEYSEIGGSSCNLVAQPGTSGATIEWKWVKVGHNATQSRPTTWQEWLTSDGRPVIVETTTSAISNWMGNAETAWSNPNCAFNDQTANYLICAWGKEKGINLNNDNGWDPFPATIETVDGSKVFVVHGKPATTEGDASAWDNQFWIQSPKEWKTGDQVKIHFRYKASKDVTVATQCHKQNPSDYLIWHAIGDITFSASEWKEFDDVMSIGEDMNGTWSIAFQLNQNDKDAIDFYFDDLSWQSMLLDEGFFVAGCNTTTGLEYDYDNAVEFVPGKDVDGDDCLIATIGTKGDKSSWVSQIMISTIRGNKSSFLSNTIKPNGTIQDDPSDWLDYAAGSQAKLNLPAQGVWKIYIEPDFGAIAFELIEGEAVVIKEINPNPTEITVNALERDDLADTTNQDGSVTVREEEGGSGQSWDNQFWIVANRTLAAGEKVTVKFKYKADKPATVSTQCHTTPGNYKHWAAIGNVDFTTEWQDFEGSFTVAGEADGMKSIAFNMAEIKDANNYYIKDVIWMTDDNESLIAEEGTTNEDGSTIFESKVVGGDIVPAVTGISSVVNDKKATNVTYNLAGQRVTKGYKGIVIKNGSKHIVK